MIVYVFQSTRDLTSRQYDVRQQGRQWTLLHSSRHNCVTGDLQWSPDALETFNTSC